VDAVNVAFMHRKSASMHAHAGHVNTHTHTCATGACPSPEANKLPRVPSPTAMQRARRPSYSSSTLAHRMAGHACGDASDAGLERSAQPAQNCTLERRRTLRAGKPEESQGSRRRGRGGAHLTATTPSQAPELHREDEDEDEGSVLSRLGRPSHSIEARRGHAFGRTVLGAAGLGLFVVLLLTESLDVSTAGSGGGGEGSRRGAAHSRLSRKHKVGVWGWGWGRGERWLQR
jgi:hypothetical protein